MSEFAGSTVAMQGEWGGMVVQADHRRVRFATVPKHNEVRSRTEGRPIYDNQIVLFVRHPGERDETAIEKLPHHEYEFARAWEAFVKGQSPEMQGTPLDVLFPENPSVVQMLRGLHIFNVEMLAGLSAQGMQRIGMGAQEYVARAQNFIEAAKSAAPMHAMRHELAQRDEQIAQLTAQVELLAANARKPRGRPRVEEGDEE